MAGGIRRRSAEQAAAALERATGQHLGKRQVEALTARAAIDVEAFYQTRARLPEAAAEGDLLVLSADGKGIVIKPDALRPATAKAAATTTNKLTCRLSKGEKRNRKRLAEVGAVYDLTPVPRTPADVLASKSGQSPPPAPKASAKWVTASVVDDAATVRDRNGLRRSRTSRHQARTHLGSAGRRQQPPDRAHRSRSQHPRRRRHHRG